MKNLQLLFSLVILCSLFTKAQWSADPMENNAIAVVSGEEAIPKVATSLSGVTYIAWFSNESGNYNVRLQQLDLFGYPLWEDEGLLISDNPSMTWLTEWDITVDQEDHAILTFQDIRNVDNDVFAYRISPDGDFVWGDDGIEMSSGPAFDASPKVCVTQNGNAIFAWQADSISILQKISPDGDLLWGDEGIELSISGKIVSWPQLLPVGEDDVLLKYFNDSGPYNAPTRHVYAQRFDSTGDGVWENPCVISDAGGISAWTQIFPFISDGEDGFYIAWHDDRDSDNHSSIFVQHVDQDGQVLLGDDGTEASTQSGRQNFDAMLALPEESEDIFIFWNEMDSDQNDRGIYGQKISPYGERLWTDNGKAFIEISSTNIFPFSANSDGENMIIFYEKYFNAIDGSLHAMMVDKEGDFVWPDEKIEISGVESEKLHSVAASFMFDQWIAAWADDRNGNRDIYAQNIQVDGSLGSLPAQASIQIVPDTLFIDENNMDYYIFLINDSYSAYTIDTIHWNSEYWFIEDLPEFPYILEPADTLSLFIPIYYVGYGGTGTGYIYDTLFVESSGEINTSIVAFNFDVIPGIHPFEKDLMKVYPNPGSTFTFEFHKREIQAALLQILSNSGQLIRQWKLGNHSSILWDGKSSGGQECPNGLYFYQFILENKTQKGKIILVK